ncbi:hypothetical protein ABG943_00865 [Bifidobacterium catenulatum]|uniref:hypothetical protein n=1 Tax=Bifidobacterium catenulatum TaxID=1686 RepID=UPI0023EABA65|nr:hypothetical protein [Bifidobacterium catenulatum]MDF4085348.1 hypothetical protein [Bifidobacterium catenulatum]MDF4092987.1 hypothetical protein [Bifidobacterium catenulatum]
MLLVIISVYLLKRIHIFSDKSYKVVQGLVFNLTLPCAIVMSFATNKHPMNLLWLVVFGLFACMIPLFIVYFGSRGDEPRYRAYQMLNVSGLNITRSTATCSCWYSCSPAGPYRNGSSH